mgnify:CR=1 FL=1
MEVKGQAKHMSTAPAKNNPIPIQIGDTVVRLPTGIKATISTSDGLRINVVPTRTTRRTQARRPKASVSSIQAQLQRVESIVQGAGRMGAQLDLIRRSLGIEVHSRDYWTLQYRLRCLCKSGRLVQIGSKGQGCTYHLGLSATGEEGPA